MVGGHGDGGSHCGGQGEEDLGGCRAPSVCLGQVAHVRGEVVRDSFTRAVQCDCFEENDDQQKHGEQDGEIRDLPKDVLATNQRQPSHEPHRHQRQEQLPLHVPAPLIPKARRVEHGLPEIVTRRAPPTLLRVPGQSGSKGLDEIDHSPPQQRLVVGQDHTCHDDTHVGNASPGGIHVREGTHGSELELMTQHCLENKQRSRNAEQ
mmetsp:Transcript_6238/g.13446  ORF Transcript_6238/g.13446 Transcript_6238/m.13446 type:complete len:206 (-) Transcript_6238:244-861(-)